MDVIFLTYANSHENFLPSLREESDAIYRALAPGAMKQHYLLHNDPLTSLDKIAEFLILYKERLMIYHFGGHADQKSLDLSGEIAHSKGIAHILGQCPKLKLAVLNGCSTQGQVEALLNNGVPIVIATSAPIEDAKAQKFASTFYQSLSNGMTIMDAFEMAIGVVTSLAPDLEHQIARNLQFLDEEKDKAVWGFFYKEENRNLLNFKLPTLTHYPVPSNYTVNDNLINKLWESLKEVIGDRLTGIDDEMIDPAEQRMAVINNYPAPVNEKLRLLMVPLHGIQDSADKLGLARLNQMVQAYRILMDLLSFTLLAQLWETGLTKGSLEIPNEELQTFKEFLQRQPDNQQTFDYLNLIRSIWKIINLNGGNYFISELSKINEWIEKQGTFQEATFFLEALRLNIEKGQINPQEIVEYCIRAEESLTEILCKLCFLAKYSIVTIQSIDVLKYRHAQEASFEHVIVILRNLLGGYHERKLKRPKFMDNRSIVLYNHSTKEFLSLTPFIINKNAFEKSEGVLVDLYFYEYLNPDRETYVFQNVQKPTGYDSKLYIQKNTPGLGIIFEQMEALQSLLNKTQL